MIKCPNCGSTAQVKVCDSSMDYNKEVYTKLCRCECGCRFEARFICNPEPTYEVLRRPTKRAIIVEAEENRLQFSDGTIITADHCQDCCECNYAKFDDLDDIAMNTVFDMNNLEIEVVEGSGIRIGNKPSKMFFVPCYSEQNGYYSSDLDIYINGVRWAHIEECEMRY